jgi:DNA-binding NarL/FixJ family response regulator
VSLALFLLSDHVLFRSGLNRLLRREPDVRVVGDCELTIDVSDAIARSGADVALLSITDPRMAVGPAAQRLYRSLPNTPVVLLLMADPTDEVLEALQLGARGVLDRSADAAKLIGALKQTVAGEITLTPRLATRLVGEYAAVTAGKRPGPRGTHLSDREIEVLTLLARGETNQEIAEQLCLSVHTVRAHLRGVMQKLGVRNRVEAAAYALSSGMQSQRPSFQR